MEMSTIEEVKSKGFTKEIKIPGDNKSGDYTGKGLIIKSTIYVFGQKGGYIGKSTHIRVTVDGIKCTVTDVNGNFTETFFKNSPIFFYAKPDTYTFSPSAGINGGKRLRRKSRRRRSQKKSRKSRRH
jgi:hypothetical protein